MWSFTKYRRTKDGFEKDFVSPLPVPFNYGYIDDTIGADGMPRDAIILGPRLRQGSKVEVKELGTVFFTDEGTEDNKTIASAEYSLSVLDMMKIRLFFALYAVFKTVHHLMRHGRCASFGYGGFVLSASVKK
jgi:inorganic pyrophosphatase